MKMITLRGPGGKMVQVPEQDLMRIAPNLAEAPQQNGLYQIPQNGQYQTPQVVRAMGLDAVEKVGGLKSFNFQFTGAASGTAAQVVLFDGYRIITGKNASRVAATMPADSNSFGAASYALLLGILQNLGLKGFVLEGVKVVNTDQSSFTGSMRFFRTALNGAVEDLAISLSDGIGAQANAPYIIEIGRTVSNPDRPGLGILVDPSFAIELTQPNTKTTAYTVFYSAVERTAIVG